MPSGACAMRDEGGDHERNREVGLVEDGRRRRARGEDDHRRDRATAPLDGSPARKRPRSRPQSLVAE